MPEDAYQKAMEVEFKLRKIPFEPQKVVDIVYKGVLVGRGNVDLFVGGRLVVEIKAVESFAPVHRLQTRSYTRMVNEMLGLRINFDVVLLKQGIKRVVVSASS
jgi:GxxExxY protein